jgi:hypothetical protein
MHQRQYNPDYWNTDGPVELPQRKKNSTRVTVRKKCADDDE